MISNRNMEDATLRIIKARGLAHSRVDELEQLETDTISSAQKCDFDFLQAIAIDAETWSIRVVRSPCAASCLFEFPEAEDLDVEIYCGIYIWDMERNMIQDVIELMILALLHLSMQKTRAMRKDGSRLTPAIISKLSGILPLSGPSRAGAECNPKNFGQL